MPGSQFMPRVSCADEKDLREGNDPTNQFSSRKPRKGNQEENFKNFYRSTTSEKEAMLC